MTQFADSSINMRLVFWTRNFVEQRLAISRSTRRSHRRFAEAGIEIPYPVRVWSNRRVIAGRRPRRLMMALARVYVTLKKSVFDPQGKTIHDALQGLGYLRWRT